MLFHELAYVVVQSQRLDAWREFASEVLGAMVTEESGGRALYVRTDEWAFRMLVQSGKKDRLFATGWLARDQRDYDAVRSRIEAACVKTVVGDSDERVLRGVQDFFWFMDPAGNRHEVFWGRTRARSSFYSPAGVSRFVGGALGMGHIVLMAGAKFAATAELWARLGALEISDIQYVEPLSTEARRQVTFYHCSKRHHCIAYGDARTPSFGCHHIMFEVATLDDVGRALDRASARNLPIACSLGRHANDQMISFYVETPSGFLIEYGCEGLVLDWVGHEVSNYTPDNVWGHVWQEWWRAKWRQDQARPIDPELVVA